jgi:hypothetical protein
LQIQLCGIHRDLRVGQRGFILFDPLAAFFGHFARHQIAQLTVAHIFAAGLIEGGAPLLHGGLRLLQRERVTRLVDHE